MFLFVCFCFILLCVNRSKMQVFPLVRYALRLVTLDSPVILADRLFILSNMCVGSMIEAFWSFLKSIFNLKEVLKP